MQPNINLLYQMYNEEILLTYFVFYNVKMY